MSDPSKCPVIHGAITSPNAGRTNQDWWPEQLNLSILHQHDKKSCPMDDDFEYRKEFEKLDEAQKINTLSMISPVTNEEKQKLLEAITIKDKVNTLENIISFYLHEVNFNNQTVQ